MSIAPVLHRIVLAPMQDKGAVRRNWRRFARLHPGWTLTTWTDADVQRLSRTAVVLPLCTSPAQKADVARLEILLTVGGIYVDTDCEPVKSLEPLLPLSCFFGTEDGEQYSTSVIGAETGHPAIEAYLDAILTQQRVEAALPPNEATGPIFATSVLRGRADVTLLPTAAFYPEPFEDSWQRRRKSRRQLAGPDTYVVHRWAHSWREGPKRRPQRRRRIRSAIRRLIG